jgi:large subunit ribosomal protein L7Ae
MKKARTALLEKVKLQMAKSYVKFDTPGDVQAKALQVVEAAQACGGLRKGVNETTKAIERQAAKLVVVAGDVDPEEIVMHIPMICGEKRAPYVFVNEKLALGKSAGLGVGTSAVAVTKADKSEALLKEVSEKAFALNPKAEAKPEQKAEPKSESKPEKAPKKEKAQAPA